jgi:VIT1/CCC1 family predicted Fe2+/Mn2+ transporter
MNYMDLFPVLAFLGIQYRYWAIIIVVIIVLLAIALFARRRPTY